MVKAKEAEVTQSELHILQLRTTLPFHESGYGERCPCQLSCNIQVMNEARNQRGLGGLTPHGKVWSCVSGFFCF